MVRRFGFLLAALGLCWMTYMVASKQGGDIIRQIVGDDRTEEVCFKDGVLSICPLPHSEHWWVYLILLILLAVGAIVLICLACSSNIYGLQSGRVIDKDWRRAYTQKGVYIGTEIGESNIVVGQRLPDQHVPARYRLKLQDPDNPRRKGWVTVTRRQYDMHRVGHRFDPS